MKLIIPPCFFHTATRGITANVKVDWLKLIIPHRFFTRRHGEIVSNVNVALVSGGTRWIHLLRV